MINGCKTFCKQACKAYSSTLWIESISLTTGQTTFRFCKNGCPQEDMYWVREWMVAQQGVGGGNGGVGRGRKGG